MLWDADYRQIMTELIEELERTSNTIKVLGELVKTLLNENKELKEKIENLEKEVEKLKKKLGE